MGEDEGDPGQRERDVVEGRGRDRIVALLLILAVGGGLVVAVVGVLVVGLVHV